MTAWRPALLVPAAALLVTVCSGCGPGATAYTGTVDPSTMVLEDAATPTQQQIAAATPSVGEPARATPTGAGFWFLTGPRGSVVLTRPQRVPAVSGGVVSPSFLRQLRDMDGVAGVTSVGGGRVQVRLVEGGRTRPDELPGLLEVRPAA